MGLGFKEPLPRKWFFFAFYLLLGFSLSQCATTNQKLTNRVLEVNDNLNTIYSENHEGAFFKRSFTEEKILFISRKENILLAVHKGEVGPLPFAEWDKKIPQSSVDFDIIKSDKKPILVIHLDNAKDEMDSLMHTILHEGFHHFVQIETQNWKTSNSKKGRGTIYPILSLPRYYRWEIQQALIQYMESKDDNFLHAYSYWYWKWRTNFLDEYQSYTDRVEGTAEYYTQKLMAFLETRSTDSDDVYDYFKKNPFGKMDLLEEFDATTESYHLGPMVGIILDQLGEKDWQNKVIQGASLFDLLEKKFIRKRQKTNHKRQNNFMTASVREMTKIDKDGKLDAIISSLANPKTHRLVLPMKNIEAGSFAASGMYQPYFNFKGLEQIEIVALASPFSLGNKKWRWNYKDGDYWIRTQKSPCGKRSTVVVLKESEFNYLKNKITFTDQSIKPIRVKRKKTKHTHWYCAG